MSTKISLITVFEHSSLKIHNGSLNETQLEALQQFHGEKGNPYYTLTHKGVKFKEYVGVIQVGKTIIEVLPKTDQSFAKNQDQAKWRKCLIDMLKAVGMFDIHAPSSSNLQIKANHILDLYFELFVHQIESLIYRGLIKKYRKTEYNCNSLKGSLQFGKHLQYNLVHQERFFVRHITYDTQHLLHQLLYKTILLIQRLNTNLDLQSKIKTLLLDFPEQNDLNVSEATFEKIISNRKTAPYKSVIEIARLLLLNYHPDIAKGQNNVLALMFDMNLLWEQFVYVSLFKGFKKNHPNVKISTQSSKNFWQSTQGKRSFIRPDIVVVKDQDCLILDTKWKNLNGCHPSADDLQQMYVYHEYFAAQKVALIYPGIFEQIRGTYALKNPEEIEKECSVMAIDVNSDITVWQKDIFNQVTAWSKWFI